MTNDGMSPMPQGNQTDIQAALAQARGTQGTVYPAEGMGQGQPVEMHPGYVNPPVQSPVQMPSGGSVRPSQPLPRGGAVPVQGQPANESVTLTGPSTDARGVSLNPNLNYPFRSNFENFQQEIPRSNVYGPLQNPRTVRNMSPDYQEASAAPVAPARTITPVAVQLAPSHKPAVSIYDVIWQEHDRIPERLHQITPGALTGAIATGINKTLFPMLRNGFLRFGSGSTIEPLSRVTHVARTATTSSRLTPQAQKVADSLKFTFSH